MAPVIANGVALHTLRFGDPDRDPDRADRPMVVFVHGLLLADLSSFYFSLAGTIKPFADVLLYDLRGHGRSELAAHGYTIDAGVADLVGVLDAHGITAPVHLVANSYGAAIALKVAVRHPERVASMMLIEGHYQVPGWGDEMAATLVSTGRNLDVESLMEQLLITSPRKAARFGVRADRLIHHTTLLDDLRGEPVLATESIRAIEAPTLCCYGSYSDLHERGLGLAELLADSHYALFVGATHSLLAERTTELRRHLLDWMTAHGGIDAAAAAPATAADRTVDGPASRTPRAVLSPRERLLRMRCAVTRDGDWR